MYNHMVRMNASRHAYKRLLSTLEYDKEFFASRKGIVQTAECALTPRTGELGISTGDLEKHRELSEWPMAMLMEPRRSCASLLAAQFCQADRQHAMPHWPAQRKPSLPSVASLRLWLRGSHALSFPAPSWHGQLWSHVVCEQ